MGNDAPQFERRRSDPSLAYVARADSDLPGTRSNRLNACLACPESSRGCEGDHIGLGNKCDEFYSDINFYPYVDNDPTVLIDPYGLYTCVGKAVCNFTPDMNKALDAFEKCLGRDFKITCGNNGHPATDPHMKGLAVDIGHGINPWLSRDQVVKCFYDAFPNTAYGQQEYNKGDSGEYHYHIQYTPGVGGPFTTHIFCPSKAMPLGEPPVAKVFTVFAPYHRSRASWLAFGSVGSGQGAGNDPLSGDCAVTEEVQKITDSNTPSTWRSLTKDLLLQRNGFLRS